MIVVISYKFTEYLDGALLRLRGQFPEASFAICDGGIVFNVPDQDLGERVERAVVHAVYREKIYSETLQMRTALFSAVLR